MLALVAIDRAVMILRWILLLRASGIPISTGEAMRLFLVSSFVGSFLPAGIGADAARAYGLSRDCGDRAATRVASVAVDRLLGVLSLVVMAVVGVLAWAPEGPQRLAHRRGDRRRGAIACGAVFWANELAALDHPGASARGFLHPAAAEF